MIKKTVEKNSLYDLTKFWKQINVTSFFLKDSKTNKSTTIWPHSTETSNRSQHGLDENWFETKMNGRISYKHVYLHVSSEMSNHYHKPTIPKTTKQEISIHIIIQFYIRPHLKTAYWKTEGKRKAQGCRNTDRKIFDRKKKKILIIHKSTTDLIQILTDSKFLMSIGVTVQWKHKLIRVAHYRTPEIIEGTSRTRK